MSNQRSASAARIGGDDYQHLLAWIEVLRAHRPDRRVVEIAVEAVDAGSFDDVTVRYEDRPGTFMQIKYTVDTKVVDLAYLTAIATEKGTSLFQKFHASWLELGGSEAAPNMLLVTNRTADPDDPLFGLLDKRTSTLVKAVTRGTTKTDEARDGLSSHLGLSSDELTELLGHLQFHCGLDFQRIVEQAADLMATMGMRAGDDALLAGVGLVRSWVAEGTRAVPIDRLTNEVAQLDLVVREPLPTLLIQGIDRDLHPDDADAAVDWVDHYIGDEPSARRELNDPALYSDALHPELRDAADRILAHGPAHVLVKGAMRLGTSFAAGAALPKVKNVELGCRQGGDVWFTDAGAADMPATTTLLEEPARGDEVAVIVSVAAKAAPAAGRYIEAAALPVGRVVEIQLERGVGDQTIEGAEEAVGAAVAIRDAVREVVDETGSRRVHRFLATPAALALFLGHRWNRVGPTQVYEDLGAGRGYEPSFEVSG